MTPEQFVPLSIATMLTEVGFNEPCCARYLTDGSGRLIIKERNDVSPDHQAPTYQQVIDWLRIKHHLTIVIKPDRKALAKYGWVSSIYHFNNKPMTDHYSHDQYYGAMDSAIIDSIKYIKL